MALQNISNFIANMSGGGLRPNLFRVIITFPNEVGGAQASQKISFTCKSATLPSSQLGVVNAPYMGRVAKFAGDRVFDDWSISVLLDTDLISRDAFFIVVYASVIARFSISNFIIVSLLVLLFFP